MKTYTGTIEVSDGVISYRTELIGDWTRKQIAAAFANGYDTGECPEGGVIECDIRQVIHIDEDNYDLKSVDGFTMTCDGHSGVVQEFGRFPNKVSWVG